MLESRYEPSVINPPSTGSAFCSVMSCLSSKDASRPFFAVEVDHVTEPEWNTVLDQFADANIYQTWAYGKVCWGRSHLSHLLLKRNGVTCGMAQVRLVTIPVLRRGVAYIFWGPLWRRRNEEADPAVFSGLINAIRREYVARRNLLLRVAPKCFTGDSTLPLVQDILHSAQFKLSNQAAYRTVILDLASSLEQLRKNLDQKWRNQLNRAEKNNIIVHEGTDVKLYQHFKSVYEEMMTRKAFETTVDINRFERIQRSLPERQKMHTLVALKDDKPISALVASTIGESGIYLLGATSNEGMQHKGSYLLQWRMIQHLKQIGSRYYDLGGINPETNPGVYHFKSGLGGHEVSQSEPSDLCNNWLSTAVTTIGERLRDLNRRKKSAGKTGPTAV